MRIVYFADGPWSHKAIELLIKETNISIVCIVARYPSGDERLRSVAADVGCVYRVPERVNSDEFLNELRGLNADLFVSMSYDQIFKDKITNMAPKGLINCHAGALPFYRGRNVLNWALINGESKFGVTVHYVDGGIDTGDIILQRFGDISISDTYRTLLDKAVNLCASTLCDAIELIRKDEVVPVAQNSVDPVGFYCARRVPGDELIDWNVSSERLHNFIRAITLPGPCARAFVQDQEFAIVRSEPISGAPDYIGRCGEVVGVSKRGIVVKTSDNTILITEIAVVDESGKIGEISVPRMKIGTRFEVNKGGH
ncbi:methionyl-tRNA formyltransferase [Thalassospira povalilytica]|uniref:methionyl-tRNA formyltransferase n=1 Tax=Thalassospira povalilytica TaxID=732237 RepID=UPI003AA94170